MTGSDSNKAIHKTGVLLVTYNQLETTRRFLTNFWKLFAGKGDLRLLVLDNNSDDETCRKLNDEFPNLDVRKLNHNYGCVTGRNIGIVELVNDGCEYICLLDNDVEVTDPMFFEKMSLFMSSREDLDGCCPVVLWGDDHSVQTMGGRIGGLRGGNITNISGRAEVDRLPGCAQFMKADAFRKFGLYDNDLSPISIEDYEWGFRAKMSGAKLACNTTSVLTHHHARWQKDTHEKMAFVIIGRTVFLRKNFTLLNLAKEAKFAVRAIAHYGLSFALKSYSKGLRKATSPRNFDFAEFSSHCMSEFFKEC